MEKSVDRVYGCLIGGAIGDAFGAPVKYLKYEQIIDRFGEAGLVELLKDKDTGVALITDDTQMTLFTAEGLLRSMTRARQKDIERTKKDATTLVFRAYLRWLYTQGLSTPNWGKEAYDGWLVKVKSMHGYREPGVTCLTALGKGFMGTLVKPINDSKRCGTVIRIAPVGLIEQEEDVFEMGMRVGAITHGHPTAYLASGMLATWIYYLVHGDALEEGLNKAIAELKKYEGHEACLEAIERAIELAREGEPSYEKLESFGDGFMCEDALAMAVYCTLSYTEDFTSAILLAINQSGNSNSAAVLVGNIMGVHLGAQQIDEALIKGVELQKEIKQMAEDLYHQYDDSEEWKKRYPGW